MKDTDSPEFYADWQKEYDDLPIEDPGISAAELYQILLSQQQQLQDFGLVLQQMTKVMQQTHNPPPDYQPLLGKIISFLVEMKQQNQQLPSLMSRQQETLHAIKSEVGNIQQRLSEVAYTTNSQAKVLNKYLSWSATLCYGVIGLLTGANLLISYQLFSGSVNSNLEKKIDKLNAQAEKMFKKGR